MRWLNIVKLALPLMIWNKTNWDLTSIKCGGYMQIKVKVSALYLIKILYATILIKMFNI